jgi:transposase-like protein
LSKEEDYLTAKHEFNHDVKLDVETKVRQGVKTVLEEVLQEEMIQHLEAGYRELTSTRRGERNGHYQRNLLTPAGNIERLEVPRDREGKFVTDLFERYKRMTGDMEEAVLGMYLSGISVRKIDSVTDALSKVGVGKDVGPLTISPEPQETSEYFETTREETVQQPNGPEAKPRYMEPTTEEGNYGPSWEGSFEKQSYTYTLNVPWPTPQATWRGERCPPW